METEQARLSLHLSKCHIVGNHMSRLHSVGFIMHTIDPRLKKTLILLHTNINGADQPAIRSLVSIIPKRVTYNRV